MIIAAWGLAHGLARRQLELDTAERPEAGVDRGPQPDRARGTLGEGRVQDHADLFRHRSAVAHGADP